VVPADDHWKVPQLRPVAFLDGGVESVAVEMGNGETMKFLVPHDPCRSAGRAGFGFEGRLVATVTAQGFHGMIIAPGRLHRKMSVHVPVRQDDPQPPCGRIQVIATVRPEFPPPSRL